MRIFGKKLLVVFGVLALTACTTASLKELRQAKPSGTPFQIALAQEYLAFSESEAKQYDWGSSKYFADKGLQSAYGQNTVPEDSTTWHVAPEFRDELVKARETLIALLVPATTDAKPELSARAQFFYDCWVEQQQEGWQVEDITSCKQGFYEAVRDLQGAPSPALEAEEDAMPLSSSYVLFFDWAKATIKPDAMQVVDTVAADVKAGPAEYEIVLNGHADRSGSTEFNLKLSQKRAEAVRDELVKRGIPNEHISYHAFGESEPRVPTADGEKLRANRRVEIFFNQ